MMIKKYIILMVGLVAILISCKKPQGFDYRDIKNIKIENLGFDSTLLKMDLVYFNPNNFGVTLKNVNCEVYINKKFLGNYYLDTIMKIEKKSEFILPSKIQVNMQNIYKNVFTLLFSNEVELNVKGTSKVSKFGISITVPFNYTGKHKVDIF